MRWLACQPKRSVRSKRRLAVWGTVFLSIGVLLALLSGPARIDLVSPGDLTFKHGTVARSCEACHGVPLEQARSWIQSVGIQDKGELLNKNCLGCHELGAQPASPHGQSAAMLAALDREALNNPSTSSPPALLAASKLLLEPEKLADGSLYCGTCHREHQGQRFDLTLMDNQRCQACRSRQFHSFRHGHPEFTDYPYIKRTEVFFDHESHLGRHFKELPLEQPGVKAPTSCNDCHEPAQREGMMLVRSFSRSCAECHLSQVTDSTLGGVRFLNLPGLDVATLRTQEHISASTNGMLYASFLPQPTRVIVSAFAGVLSDPRIAVPAPFSIGEWPVSAMGPPTSFLRLLLATDPATAKVLTRLEGVDLADLHKATPTQLQDVKNLIWAIKDLFYDLAQDDELALIKRYRKLTSDDLSHDQLTALTGDLPVQFVLEAMRKWLPSLQVEVQAYRAGRSIPVAIPPTSVASTPAFPIARSRWYRRDENCTIEYLPRRHTDMFLRGWLDLTAAGASPSGNALFPPVFDTIANPTAAGRCTKCHSLTARPDHSFTIHWETAQPKINERPFTRFAHAPHFSLLEGKSCEHCHIMNPKAPYAESFVLPDNSLRTDAGHFASNFTSMRREQCTSCHTAEQAGNSCLLCHNYHVGTFAAFGTPIGRLNDTSTRASKLRSHP